ncbi:Gfo/Idh/MocA family protein [Sutcliffiella rhizosphaerae]|uniref:Scyllo-inositol 2-dehydrogenase (NADP(+)) IolU n=1 Tax=Sutcliffiella rhizosphaerae TaxID=2880967 RepID=A0ABM8YNU1_9BACI|nr:Gfo/Idh/MocA family oxidoreductase [Sutcliffiella rhizosphaerae]CAG9621662.1 scyllo-inositol 2-dehydrogenase (NADP(+)) IolU [Sutcliffiella rhizosphaerae]
MVRFGIIGTNRITESFIDAARELNDFKLSAIYSRKQETATDFAAKYDVEHTYTDLNEFAKSEHTDAVYIASPNSLHSSQAITCMQHGKHVICEKPFASTSKEVEQMIDVARRNDVVLMEAMKSTVLPNFITIKENLHKIGKVRRYCASYCQYSSRYDKYKEGIVLNAFKPEFSNGALMDIGIYTIYPMVALFGKPKFLHASSYMLSTGVDGQGSIMFTFDEMEATVNYSKIADSFLPTEIQGEAGSMIIDKIHTPENVRILYRNGSEEVLTVSQLSKSMYYEAKEFIDLINSGKKESSLNSHNNSLQTIKLIEEARRITGIVYPADLTNNERDRH